MIAVQAGGFQSNPQNPGLKKKRQMWWHMLVLPALVRQWQLDFRELWDRKTSLIDELQATGRLYIYIDLHQEQHLRLLLATTCKHTCTPHVHILIYTSLIDLQNTGEREWMQLGKTLHVYGFILSKWPY